MSAERMASAGEDAAIRAMTRALGAQSLPSGWVGIGDDAAVTQLQPGAHALTTTDLLVEGVHFRTETISAEDLGWKAIAVNASDIAGMGGRPRWATVSIAAPAACDLAWLEALYRGIGMGARAFELVVVGGDTVRSPGPLFIAVTVVGEAERPILRTGAMAGDRVVVTGPVGASAAGLWLLEHPEEASRVSPRYAQPLINAHRRPTAQVEAGEAVARLLPRVAMMDDSDGLARSALWLAGANGLKIRLEAELVPVNAETRHVAHHAGVDPLDWGLYGGEDYHLVLTCPPELLGELARGLMAIGVTATAVGTCLAGDGATVVRDGQETPLDPRGAYRHFG